MPTNAIPTKSRKKMLLEEHGQLLKNNVSLMHWRTFCWQVRRPKMGLRLGISMHLNNTYSHDSRHWFETWTAYPLKDTCLEKKLRLTVRNVISFQIWMEWNFMYHLMSLMNKCGLSTQRYGKKNINFTSYILLITLMKHYLCINL